MPRDKKGNALSCGSVMETATGQRFTVAGFVTIAKGRIDIMALPWVFGTHYGYHRCTDVHVVNPSEKSFAVLAADDSGDSVVWGS